MLLLIAYDIPNDRRRGRVRKALTRLGPRVQYSVFLVECASAEHAAQLLLPLVDSKEDDVRIHPVCASCLGKAVLLGLAKKRARAENYRII